jgi:lipoprotein-anchoring transpeptidase ErfK/SrfK
MVAFYENGFTIRSLSLMQHPDKAGTFRRFRAGSAMSLAGAGANRDDTSMKRFLAAAVTAAALLGAGGAGAQTRYVEPPPVMVSPDLSAPWVLQLRQAQRVQPRQYQRQRVVRQAQPQYRQAQPVYRQQRQVVQPQQVRPQQQAALAARAPAKPKPQIDPIYLPQVVEYSGPHGPGTVVVDTANRFLYLVEAGGKARRYGVGVGKEGFEWRGTEKITRKREWPDWRPPAEMIAREKKKGRILPVHMKGGPANPLGARALYLGSTLYRIHGTNAPWSIGQAVSSGCIRMRNEDVMDLYNRVSVGTKVVVL